MTHELEIYRAAQKVDELNDAAKVALRSLVCLQNTDEKLELQALLDYQSKSTRLFNYVEGLVGSSDLLGAREREEWAQGFAEDCFAILEQMPGHWELLRLEFDRLKMPVGTSIEPASTAFANMQRMVVAYLPDRKEGLRSLFQDAELPTYGFDNKAKKFMKADKVLSFAFGVTFVVTLLIIALVKPDPTDFQYKVFSTVLALAGAGVGAVIPGFIDVRVSKYIRAGGALAVLAMFYFWNPARMV